MLDLVFAESELELIPAEILDHPQVKEYAKKKNKDPADCLLDATFCSKAVIGLDEGTFRGRPEIIHICLLTALESILNRKNQLRIWIHTRNNLLIEVNPKTRVPRAYSRFVSFMEELLSKGQVPPEGEPLMVMKEGKLKDLIQDIKPSKVILLSHSGRITSVPLTIKTIKKLKNPMIVIGGFADRDFSKQILRLADRRIRLVKEHMTAWTALGMVLYNLDKG